MKKKNPGRLVTVAVLVFVLSLVVSPMASFAQDLTYSPDYGSAGGGGSSCNYCSQTDCGCDQWFLGLHLSSYSCECGGDSWNNQGTGSCTQTCNYG
jgi:hypothetical protein